MPMSDELRKHRMFNRKEFIEWAKDHSHTMLISYPRSGRDWFCQVLSKIVDKPTDHPFDMDGRNYEDKLLYKIHGGWYWTDMGYSLPAYGKYILLVRDPRDCALSGAYRQVYYQYERLANDMSLELVSKSVSRAIRVWPITLEHFLSPNTLIVQYEKLCLFPEVEWRKLLDFLDEDIVVDIKESVHKFDQITWMGMKPVSESSPESIARYRIFCGNSMTDRLRYESHCLKWKKDLFFTDEFNDLLYNKIGNLMESFGYLKNEHDIKLWRSQN